MGPNDGYSSLFVVTRRHSSLLVGTRRHGSERRLYSPSQVGMVVASAAIGTSSVARGRALSLVPTPVPTVGSIHTTGYPSLVTVPIDWLPGGAFLGGPGLAKQRRGASPEPRFGVRPAGMRRPPSRGREPNFTVRGWRQHRPSRGGHGARRSPRAPEALVREGNRRGEVRPGSLGASERVRARQE